ncbi:MAG: L-aspartate oxidase [Bacillota bacterium]
MKFDFIIVGGGIAGLNAAIRLSKYGEVLLVTKEKLEDCNTVLAQGGIAASLGLDDSPELHLQDTLAAGDGLCDEGAVRVMVKEAPVRIKELISLGVPFDTTKEGLALTREGAHSRNRILHAGGDATGKLIWQQLASVVYAEQKITVWEHALVLDIIVTEGICTGIMVLDLETQQAKTILGRAVLLTSGGSGRMYPVTTNPPTATGDGIAMAYRAGVELRDVEFIQFHPTALAGEPAAGFLISEAVRGEGAFLRDCSGNRFLVEYHPLAELAPRDVVARAIQQEMIRSGKNHVFLDATHFSRGFFAERFPQIHHQLAKIGINPEKDLIPVAPAAHYTIGGIKTGLLGETSLQGLFACGEVSSTGVHGANRLGSNSLLEGLIFSSRAAEIMPEVNWTIQKPQEQSKREKKGRDVKPFNQETKRLMQKYVGIVRNEEGLKIALQNLECYYGLYIDFDHTFQQIEDINLGLVAYLCTFAALQRKESRGSHFRSDYPEKSKMEPKHLILKKGELGEVLCL